MSSTPFTNLFELTFSPPLRTMYRGLRQAEQKSDRGQTVVWGKHVYSPIKTAVCPERVETSPEVLKNMIHKSLAAEIVSSDKFFDTHPGTLSATVAARLLHKEEAFSIARSFQLQILFDHRAFYVAVLAGLKLYNRLRLPDVLRLLGENALSPPYGALCFAGKGTDARWRDGKVLALSGGSCVVHVPSIHPSEITVPAQRVIPRLGAVMIKRLLHMKGSRTRVELKLKQLRSKAQGGEGEYLFRSSVEVLQEHVRPLFPLALGDHRVTVADKPFSTASLDATTIEKHFRCASEIDGQRHVFDSPLNGLQTVRFSQARSHPVALFCTPETRQGAEALVAALNSPPDTVGGFRGMTSHFGIELRQLPDSPYVVRDVEEYVRVAQDLVLSPSPDKENALALIALSEEDETYRQPVPLYYRLKALLARSGHPSQMVSNDTLTNKYARWNLALNIAAKLGAIPWTLEDRRSLEPVDMFLGFSYSSIRTERLGQSRNIAYVNVFDGSGTWQVFCADGSVFSFEERLKVFPRVAAEAVRSATDEPERLRLIEVHYNKRFGYRERQAIASGIREHAPDASIIFVSISDDHPLRFFDAHSPQWSCERGSVFQPGPTTAYVQTIEADRFSGLPRPLRVQVYRDFSTVAEDPLAVSERVLGLTRLNWRSVKDYSSLPVTVLYSSLVAKFTNYFSLTDWKEIDHHLKRTPWFL